MAKVLRVESIDGEWIGTEDGCQIIPTSLKAVIQQSYPKISSLHEVVTRLHIDDIDNIYRGHDSRIVDAVP